MATEIEESTKNRVFRMMLRTLFVFLIIFGIFFIIFQIIANNLLLSSIGLPIVVMGYLLGKGVCRIKNISEDSVLLESGKGQIKLHKDDFSILKLIRFTVSQRFLFAILPKRIHFFTIFYLVVNEPKYDLFNKLKKMGIRFYNVSQ